MADKIQVILTAVVTSGLLTPAIAWLASLWLSERLKLEYARQLESHKATLKAQFDVELAERQAALKSAFDLKLAEHQAGLSIANAASIEALKGHLAARQEAGRNVQNAVAELTKRFAAATHSICWLCWTAKYAPADLTPDHFQSYDKEMHSLLGEIMAARVVLASLHRPSHEALSSFADRVYNLDFRVGQAKVRYSEPGPKDAALQLFSTLLSEANQYDRDLLDAVAALPDSIATSSVIPQQRSAPDGASSLVAYKQEEEEQGHRAVSNGNRLEA